MKGLFAKLLSIKSIVTIIATLVFAYLAVVNRLSQEFLVIYSVIVSFYFGTQHEKQNGVSA